MKIFLSTIILALSIVIFPQHSLAQTQASCLIISSEADFRRCGCEDNYTLACSAYDESILLNAGGDNQGGDPQNVCSIISVDNYQNCCEESADNFSQCKKYLDNGGEIPVGDGTVTSGFPPGTNPQNGATTPPGTIAPTPQGSSAALKSCNAISFDSILDILIWLKCIIAAAIIPLIFTLAFLFFLWGMVMFIRGADDVKKREESKKFIYWGIIALTVMISVWGIIKIVNNTLGFGNTVPALQTDYLKSPETPKTP